MIETHFEQLKAVHEIAAVFLKNTGRIEAFFALYFLAVLIRALIQCQPRLEIQRQKITQLIQHALGQMQESLERAGVAHLFRQKDDTNHLAGCARMGFDARTSVVNADCLSWDIPNLSVCDGSVFPAARGVNPSLAIQAVALRTAERIKELAACGDLS